MTEGAISSCRSCGAQVVFRLNPNTGKSPPYDYPATACECVTRVFTRGDDQGNVVNTVDAAPDCTKCAGLGAVWISHFATCPDAQKWKGKART